MRLTAILLLLPVLVTVGSAFFGCSHKPPAVPPKNVVAKKVPPKPKPRATSKKSHPFQAAARKPPTAVPRKAPPPEPRTQDLLRVVFFSPDGPAIIDALVLIDGVPRESWVNQRIDSVLQLGSSDGHPNWEQLARAPEVVSGELGNDPPGNGDGRRQLIESWDLNHDGTVNRDEVLPFITKQRFDARGISFDAAIYEEDLAAQRRLLAWLDQDSDGALSAQEIAASRTRLTLLDQNSDGVLAPREVQGESATLNQNEPKHRSLKPDIAVLLTGSPDWDAVGYAFEEMYAHDGTLKVDTVPLLAKQFTKLDADADGELASSEVRQLEKVSPHFVVTLQCGNTSGVLKPVSVRPAEILQPGDLGITDSADSATLTYREVLITIRKEESASNVEAELGRFFAADKNKTGDLDADEIKSIRPNQALRLERDDLNHNSKLERDEARAALRRSEVLKGCTVQLRASTQDGVLGALDTNCDGWLSEHEITGASAKLHSMDLNQDSELTADEVSGSQQLAVTLGAPAQTAQSQSIVPTPGRVPDWFKAMDLNGDGELSAREFLGSASRFEALDEDRDGFIEPKETGQASGK